MMYFMLYCLVVVATTAALYGPVLKFGTFGDAPDSADRVFAWGISVVASLLWPVVLAGLAVVGAAMYLRSLFQRSAP